MSEPQSELERALVDHLRLVAARLHRRQGDPGSVRPSSLVQEAWLRLSRQDSDRSKFLLLATRVMRQILIDRARRRLAQKRGGGQARVELDGLGSEGRTLDIVAVETALTELEALDPRGARVVELKCFAGLELEEIGSVLGVSSKTVARDWRMCRAWLSARLDASEPHAADPPKDRGEAP